MKDQLKERPSYTLEVKLKGDGDKIRNRIFSLEEFVGNITTIVDWIMY